MFLAHPSDILVFQEKASGTDQQAVSDNPFEQVLDQSHILYLHQHHQEANDPANPRWKIPSSEWLRVRQRIEQGETLRQVARDYGVSYEAVRRVVRAARCQFGNGEV